MALPAVHLPGGARIVTGDSGTAAEVEVESADRLAAKEDAVRIVDDLVAVLAAWGGTFQLRTSGVQVTQLGRPPGAITVESRIDVVMQKGDLDTEAALFGRRDHLPEYVRNCLELNYLIVLSDRPTNRWLLAVIGLEALAVGTLGAQPDVSARLTAPHPTPAQEGPPAGA